MKRKRFVNLDGTTPDKSIPAVILWLIGYRLWDELRQCGIALLCELENQFAFLQPSCPERRLGDEVIAEHRVPRASNGRFNLELRIDELGTLPPQLDMLGIALPAYDLFDAIQIERDLIKKWREQEYIHSPLFPPNEIMDQLRIHGGLALEFR